jgi:hypothetical protein
LEAKEKKKERKDMKYKPHNSRKSINEEMVEEKCKDRESSDFRAALLEHIFEQI